MQLLCDALSTFEGAIIAVSHDEEFVNQVIAGRNKPRDQQQQQPHQQQQQHAAKKDALAQELGGQIWVMSKQELRVFDGTFQQYKQLVLKRVVTA